MDAETSARKHGTCGVDWCCTGEYLRVEPSARSFSHLHSFYKKTFRTHTRLDRGFPLNHLCPDHNLEKKTKRKIIFGILFLKIWLCSFRDRNFLSLRGELNELNRLRTVKLRTGKSTLARRRSSGWLTGRDLSLIHI